MNNTRVMLELAAEQFRMLAKLASHERIYEVEKRSGKRVRKPLREVVVTECEAAAVKIEEALRSTPEKEG